MSSLSQENAKSKAAIPEDVSQPASIGTDQTNDASAASRGHVDVQIADTDEVKDDGPATVEGSKPGTHDTNIDNAQGQEFPRESGSTAMSIVLELESRKTSVSHLTMETFDDSEEPERHASMLATYEEDAKMHALKHEAHAASSEGRSDASDEELLKAKKAAYLKPEQNKGFLQDGSLSGDKKSSTGASIESIDGSSCPLPFYSTNTGVYDSKVAKEDKSLGLSSSNQYDESIVHPPREESMSEATPAVLESRKASLSHLTMETLDDSVEPERHASMLATYEEDAKMHAFKYRVAESQEGERTHATFNSNSNETVPATTPEQNISADVNIPLPNQEEPEAHLIEAYAVDEQIYSAEKVEVVEEIVWWKQRRTKFLVAGLSLLIVSVIAVAAKLSRQTVITQIIATERTESPSMSFTPSLSPTSCFQKIEASRLEIDLEVNDPYTTVVAMDGKNVVIGVQDLLAAGGMFLHFYSLNNNGDWQRSALLDFPYSSIWSYELPISLSGKTAFIAFGEDVFVYEQSSLGNWKEVNEPFVFQDRPSADFGSHVNVDGDLACVEDNGSTHLFKREGGKWVQFDVIEGMSCSISQNTVAVYTENLIHLYRYIANQNEVVPIQEPIQANVYSTGTGPTYHFALHNNYLVHTNWKGNVSILKRNEKDRTYVFQQQLQFGGYSTLICGIELHYDVLAIASGDEIKVAMEEDGMWAERDTLYSPHNYNCNSPPNNFVLSRRNMIAAASNSVYVYNIEDCVQPLLSTQYPTIGPTTTQYPSISPTTSSAPSASMSPSISTSPTSCMEKSKLQIDLRLDDPQDVMVATDGDNMVVAVRDGDYCMNSAMALYFYHLINESEWQLVTEFEFSDDDHDFPSLSLSGSTAFLGFEFAGINGKAVVYEQNDAGEWEEVDDPFVFNTNMSVSFGVNIGDTFVVDGDLACVVHGNERVYLFHRDGEKWVEIQFESMEGWYCSISNNTIAVVSSEWKGDIIGMFEYIDDQNEAVPIQDPIYTERIYDMDHNNDYLVYSGFEENAFVYKRNNTDGTFVFQQQLNVTLGRVTFGNDNVLAMSAFNDAQAQVLMNRNETWDVILEIDVEYFSLALSEHILIGGTNNGEVHIYPIQSCADDVTSTLKSRP